MSERRFLLPGWPVDRPAPQVAAMMQPYLFAYPGYFSLIQNADVFLLNDCSRYTPKRWMNRNRLRSADGGWKYFTLPVRRCPQNTPVCAVPIASSAWKEQLLGRLTVYAGAPYYREVLSLLQPLLQSDFTFLGDLTALSVALVVQYLNIGTPVFRLSRLELPGYCPPYPKGENALAVCRALGTVREYRNPPGGAAFYPRRPYRDAGIRLRFLEWQPPQKPAAGWQPMLSVLDGMMTVPPQQLAESLRCCRLAE